MSADDRPPLDPALVASVRALARDIANEDAARERERKARAPANDQEEPPIDPLILTFIRQFARHRAEKDHQAEVARRRAESARNDPDGAGALDGPKAAPDTAGHDGRS